MNRCAIQYYQTLNFLIPSHGTMEKQLLNDMRLRLEELCDTIPDLTYPKICKELGEPKELLSNFYSNIDTNYIIKRVRFSRLIRLTATALIGAILIAFTANACYQHLLYLESHDSIVTHKIIIIE